MGLLAPDFTFAREGRTLDEWLPLLVGDDDEDRRAAAAALEAMWMGFPGTSTPHERIDLTLLRGGAIAAQMARFSAEVRAAVDAPEFPRTSFVHDLPIPPCILLA